MLNWFQIFRLGLVQLCLGAVVVLTTNTLNRLMVVELAVPAVLPGILVALHYGVQITRPNWGHRSDSHGQRSRFIILGMAATSGGAFLAALGLPVMEANFAAGLALSVVAYLVIGVGVGASGTSLLALLASATSPQRRPAAAMLTWLLMIFGIAVTAGLVGHLMDPYSPVRMLWIVATVTLGALLVTIAAVWGVEARLTAAQPAPTHRVPFARALREVWAEPKARDFTIFIFLSMTAYFLQELILEPYAGLVFGMTPGQSTTLSGAQHGGVFGGMLTVGILASALRVGSLRMWTVVGCTGSCLALIAIAALGQTPGLPLTPAVVALGFFNGMFSVAAIASMMALAGEGRSGREGTRMGLWGAAQAVAAGFGGLTGAAAADLLRMVARDGSAFGFVFIAEAALFLAAAFLAMRVMENNHMPAHPNAIPGE